MSYARRQRIRTNHAAAIIVVAIIHAIFGYALVTGLAYTTVERVIDDLKTFNVKEEPPPPPEEPPPPPEQPTETPPPVVAPPPIVQTKIVRPPVVKSVQQAPPPVVTPTAPPAPRPAPVVRRPPPPPPVKTVPPRSAVGNLAALFSPDDYPSSALRREEVGTVTVRLTVGTDGRVSQCDVTRRSGSSSLDRATCRILTSRAKFKPATDSHGKAMTDTVNQRIRWELAEQ